LFVLAPAVLVANELFSGGRLPVDAPLSAAGRTIIAVTGCMLLVGGIGLLFRLHPVTTLWPLALTPLVARIVGVWLASLGVARLAGTPPLDTCCPGRRRAPSVVPQTPLTRGMLPRSGDLVPEAAPRAGWSRYLGRGTLTLTPADEGLRSGFETSSIVSTGRFR